MSKHSKMTAHIVVLSFALVYLLATHLSSAQIHKNANGTKNGFQTAGNKYELVDDQQEKYLDIQYDEKVLKEIGPGILQVVGEPLEVDLQCFASNKMMIRWEYYATEKNNHVPILRSRKKVRIPEFRNRPPVMRLECTQGTTSNSTYIYKGGNDPPFLYKNGKYIPIITLNKTSAQLPCLLKYPLKFAKHHELQLFKDGKPITNGNISITYKPEYGYILNWENLEDEETHFGSYECRVLNSTSDDFIRIEFKNDHILQSEVQVHHKYNLSNFYVGHPNNSVFLCKVPRSNFANKFEWFFQWSDGNISVFEPNKSRGSNKTTQNPNIYIDSVGIKFNSTKITHVGCIGFSNESEPIYKGYNNTYPVSVKEPIKPVILNTPSTKPIYYKNGLSLTCTAKGDPVKFTWLKNGKHTWDHKIENNFVGPNPTSTITLKPLAEDNVAKYTCTVSNFLGNSSHDFTVRLDEPWLRYLIIVGTALAVLAVALLLVFVFCRVKMETRNPIKMIIKRFKDGIPPGEESKLGDYNDFEQKSYDAQKEIDINNLTMGDKLDEGEFGEVCSGLYRMDDGSCINVAIKSIKRDPTALKKDLDFAFENFLREIKFWQNLGEHVNVVRYIGSVTSDLADYSAYIVLEYCCQSNMKSYLMSVRRGGAFFDDVQGMQWANINRSQTPLKTSHLMKWAEEIASGMDYVSSKNLIHRDLAARNILLTCGCQGSSTCYKNDPGMLIAKISDFGMSKNLMDIQKTYYHLIPTSDKYPRSPKLPLMWMSPETLTDLKFTTKNDVWSFGIILWEMFTVGEEPYPELRESGKSYREIYKYLKEGRGLSQPDLASPEIWDIMQQCWIFDPKDRPAFSWLMNELRGINITRNNELNTSKIVYPDVVNTNDIQMSRFVDGKSQNDCNRMSTQDNSENKIAVNYVQQSLDIVEEPNETRKMNSYHSEDAIRNENIEVQDLRNARNYYSPSMLNSLPSTPEMKQRDQEAPPSGYDNREYFNLVRFRDSDEHIRKDSGYSDISNEETDGEEMGV